MTAFRSHLSDENILIVSKPLAKAFGIGQSILLRRLHFWITFNQQSGKREDTHFRDGRWWCFNSYEEWAADIEIYSADSCKRFLLELEESGVVVSATYNKRSGDKTKWYSIDYTTYDKFMELWSRYYCPMVNGNRNNPAYNTFWTGWMSGSTLGLCDLWELWADAPETPVCGDAPYPSGQSALMPPIVAITPPHQGNLPRPLPVSTVNTNTQMSTSVMQPPTEVLPQSRQRVASIIIDSDELRYEDVDSEGNPKKKPHSKKKQSGEGKKTTPPKSSRPPSPHNVTTAEYRATWAAVMEFIFETDSNTVEDPETLEEKEENAGRAGMIASWLSGKSDRVTRGGGRGKPVKVGYISKPVCVEHIRKFAEDWKGKYKTADLPLDPVIFIDHWRKWASKARTSAQGRGVWALNKRAVNS